MEFRQVQYFVCLFEEGSVTRAARRLNIVQPALSMQIAKLEEELGRKLFVRTKQGMEPTVDGRRMYGLFLPIIGEFTLARDQMRHTDGALSGLVRIGSIATVAQGVLVDALREFSQNHPLVTLAVTDGYSATLSDAVAGGQLDAAIINKPRRPLALSTELIAEEDLLLISATGDAAGHSRSVRFRQLPKLKLKLVLPTRQHGLRGIVESFAQAEDVHLAPVLEVDSISAIVKLVLDGGFATLLPRTAVSRQLEEGLLQAQKVLSPRLTRQLISITHPRRPLSPAAAAFMVVVQRHVRDIGR
jgi:LysR family transcriptional regulator, nitrogen assimilation regulatory protein